MPESTRPFIWVGHLPCLDLVNTEAMSQGERVDLLTGFDDLVRWLVEAKLLSESEGRAALERWAGRSEGQAVFRLALALRQGLRRTAERLSAGKGPSNEDVELINRVLASRVTHPALVRKAGALVLSAVPEAPSAPQLLVPVAESAAWLLTEGDAALLRRCGNPDCILYFYDLTRNGRRRWCSMDGCGSRAKAAAYYRRQRAGKRHT